MLPGRNTHPLPKPVRPTCTSVSPRPRPRSGHNVTTGSRSSSDYKPPPVPPRPRVSPIITSDNNVTHRNKEPGDEDLMTFSPTNKTRPENPISFRGLDPLLPDDTDSSHQYDPLDLSKTSSVRNAVYDVLPAPVPPSRVCFEGPTFEKPAPSNPTASQNPPVTRDRYLPMTGKRQGQIYDIPKEIASGPSYVHPSGGQNMDSDGDLMTFPGNARTFMPGLSSSPDDELPQGNDFLNPFPGLMNPMPPQEDFFSFNEYESIRSDWGLPPPLPPPRQPQKEAVQHDKSVAEPLLVGWEKVHESLVPTIVADEEADAFCDAMNCIKYGFDLDDPAQNRGYILSPVLDHVEHQPMTIKLTIGVPFRRDPVVFTCDMNSAVLHVIVQVLYSVSDEAGAQPAPGGSDDYILKVYGLMEYLLSDSVIGDYVYVQNCLKFDQDIKLTLMNVSQLKKPYLQMPYDKEPMVVPTLSEIVQDQRSIITRDGLSILMETFTNKMDEFLDGAVSSNFEHIQPRSLLQAVKAICAILNKVETIKITSAVNRLEALNREFANKKESFPQTEHEKLVAASTMYDSLTAAMLELCTAVVSLIRMFCSTFQTDFYFCMPNEPKENAGEDLSNVRDSVIIHVATAHRFSADWPTKNDNTSSLKRKSRKGYEHYRVACGLYFGGRPLCPTVMTKTAMIQNDGFQPKILWDEWIQFPSVFVSALPRETRLTLTLFGFKTEKDSSSEIPKQVKYNLGWAVLPMFDYRGHLTRGEKLVALWPDEAANPCGSTQCNILSPESILLQVNFPDFGHPVIFPEIRPLNENLKRPFEALHPHDQEQLMEILGRDSLKFLTPQENEFLWDKRSYVIHRPDALIKVLLAAPHWNAPNLPHIYALLEDWTPMKPNEAMELLLPLYADEHVREIAIKWMKNLCHDELYDYLPQLVQALKYELYHNCPLSRFLLESAASNVRIAHRLYWLFQEARADVKCQWRFHLMSAALMSMAGEGFRIETEKQACLMRGLATVAERVKATKDKDSTLLRELGTLFEDLQDQSISLPANPSMVISGVDLKLCSYFTSNAFPLKLVFKHDEPRADPHVVMFKVGDDLRQDMLTMQLIGIMDKIWLKNNLDLKIITFRCLSSGDRRGIVEIVSESETLRKIQAHYGVTGAFKDRPIAEWLQKYNPSEPDYRKAVINFTRSCAGYCVATYVLGIGDRHNDNIMFTTSGHMFHIDFGKFLGDAQMFGNIKRDRVPFVFTSDMAYVINGGDKPSDKFHEFIDLCCQAFNTLRHCRGFLLTLLRLMAASGIPGVNLNAAAYVQETLLPNCSDAEATAAFTRKIEGSLKSLSTPLNFFIHNLAQLRFSGHSEGTLLSFIPKTYSVATDGRITNVQIEGYEKKYLPDKYYVYIIRVEREGVKVPQTITRKYDEFQEFQKKIYAMFPSLKLPVLAGKSIVGRNNVQSVADKRKAELEVFLRELLKLAPEVSECDLIYTFFHPMLRDEREPDDAQKRGRDGSVNSSTSRYANYIRGQVKISIIYREGALHIMVMHAKDLASDGGEAPDTYVKMYLIPDSAKESKRKTRIIHGSRHPSFNEPIVYRHPIDIIKRRTLKVTVWNYDRMKENEFLGAVHLNLGEMDLTKETTAWYRLGLIQA